MAAKDANAAKTSDGGKTAKAAAAPVKENVVMRGRQGFRHDLFKSDVKKFKKNTSFKKGVVSIVEIDHAHIFHSHNSNGREQDFCSTVGGHFHKMERYTDAEGNLKVRCGPPITYKYVKRPGGSKRVMARVEWHDARADDNSGEVESLIRDRRTNEAYVVDNHVHEFEYLGSETLSAHKVREIQAKTQAAIAGALKDAGGSAEEANQRDDGTDPKDVGLAEDQ